MFPGDRRVYQLSNVRLESNNTSQKPIVKTAYFYHDAVGDSDENGIRVALHPNRYRSLEALLVDAPARPSPLEHDARPIYSQTEHNKFKSMADVRYAGHYICSERKARGKTVSPDRKVPVWRTGMTDYRRPLVQPTHTQRSRLNQQKRSPAYEPPRESQSTGTTSGSYSQGGRSFLTPLVRQVATGRPDLTDVGSDDVNKRIYVHLNERERRKKAVVIRRRKIQSMAQFLQELTELFGTPVTRIYTIDRRPIATIDDLLRGPSEVIATGLENQPSSLARPLATPGKFDRSRSQTKFSKLGQSPDRIPQVLPPISRNWSLSRMASTNGIWSVLVTSGTTHPETGDRYLMACTSNVLLTVCTRHESSTPILLRSVWVDTLPDESNAHCVEQGNAPNGAVPNSRLTRCPFQPGRTDIFEIQLKNVREVHKIRLSHDGTGHYPEWLPAEIRMQPMDTESPGGLFRGGLRKAKSVSRLQPFETETLLKQTKPEIIFQCMQWLSTSKGDRSLTLEIAAPGSHLMDSRFGTSFGRGSPAINPLRLAFQGYRSPVICYRLCMLTGNLWNAGTNAEVSVQLWGDRGDSGIRALRNSNETGEINFIRGKTNLFHINAVYLGRLRRLSIWLSGIKGFNPTWYLEKITVREYLMCGNKPCAAGGKKLLDCEQPLDGVRLKTVCFPCHRWIGSEQATGVKETHLVADQCNGGLDADEVGGGIWSEQEELWWQMVKWKFQPGTMVVFYSSITEVPLQVSVNGRINARRQNEGSCGNPDFATVFTVSLVPPDGKTNRVLKPVGTHRSIAPNDIHRDMERFNEIGVYSTIRHFYTQRDAWMKMALDESLGLCVVDERLDSTVGSKEVGQFRIRARPDHWIVLESWPSTTSTSSRTHVYVGPEGRIVGGARGPLSVPGKLLMPHVKGTLRDQGLLWLCTSSHQTLAPILRDSTEHNRQTGTEWVFDLKGTGARNPDAYWRVKRIDHELRGFEAFSWPGHYLRVTVDGVDIMGSGDDDCHFRITRHRSKGFIHLSPINKPEKYLGMEENGAVCLFDDSQGDNIRFYPEVIEYGIAVSRHTTPESVCTNQESSVKFRGTEHEQSSPQQDDDASSDHHHSDYTEPTVERELGSVAPGDDLNLESLDHAEPSDNQWKVSISSASTAKNCTILLVVYGVNSNSGPILIGRSDEETELFQKNSTDSFMVVLEDIKPIYKIRVELTPIDMTMDTEWELIEVTLEQAGTEEKLVFDFTGRPLGRSAAFCQLCREQVVDESAVKFGVDLAHLLHHELGLVIYQVEMQLMANSEWTERTLEFEPHFSLIGKHGDCGRRLAPLSSPPTTLKTTDKENRWVFETELEAAYLGELTRCLLGPVDVRSLTPEERDGPMCVGVTVWDPIAGRPFYFQAHTWLRSERTGQIHELHLNVNSNCPPLAAVEETLDPRDAATSEEEEEVESKEKRTDEEIRNAIHQDEGGKRAREKR
ncbi:unnamed protein product [Dicrocoelium dendriticum]|nr:unnamed protein product [Dicrocoelium dendriticum]